MSDTQKAPGLMKDCRNDDTSSRATSSKYSIPDPPIPAFRSTWYMFSRIVDISQLSNERLIVLAAILIMEERSFVMTDRTKQPEKVLHPIFRLGNLDWLKPINTDGEYSFEFRYTHQFAKLLFTRQEGKETRLVSVYKSEGTNLSYYLVGAQFSLCMATMTVEQFVIKFCSTALIMEVFNTNDSVLDSVEDEDDCRQI